MKYGDNAPAPLPYGHDRILSAPSTSLRAVGSWVLFERDPPPVQSGPCLIHLVTDEVQDMGTVVSAGRGSWCNHADVFVPTALKPGDRIVLDKNARAWETHTTADGRVLVAMREADILAVVES